MGLFGRIACNGGSSIQQTAAAWLTTTGNGKADVELRFEM
jgi:hypothetical protein